MHHLFIKKMEEVVKKRKSRWGDTDKTNESIICDEHVTEQMLGVKQPIEQEVITNKLNQPNLMMSPINLINSSSLGSIMPPVLPTSVPDFASLSYNIHLNILKATGAAKLAIERAKQASKLKENLKSGMNKKIEIIPKPLKLDEYGREIDEEGNVINIKPITYSTLKVNKNKIEEENILKNQLENLKEPTTEDMIVQNEFKWFDPRIKSTKSKKKNHIGSSTTASSNINKKKKSGFHFISPGSLLKKQEILNLKYDNNSGSHLNYDLKQIIQEKKNAQNLEELSFNFLNNDLYVNVNPNLIEIGNNVGNGKSGSDNNRGIKQWSECEKYDMIEKWDLVLLKKVKSATISSNGVTDDTNTNKHEEYINEQIEILKKSMQCIIDNDVIIKEKKKKSNLDGSVCLESENDQGNAHDTNSNDHQNDKENPLSNLYIELNVLLNRCENNEVFILENNDIIINKNLFKINMKKITKYIEHPAPLNEEKKEEDVASPPVMFLTPLEKKKLRRRKKQEKEKEKQDKIRIGLIPPPPPKMKLANLMRILGDNAIAHPSRIEHEVRQQMKERELRHYEQNQKRKLTSEEKKKKKIKKWQCDSNEKNEVLVIYITNLSNKKHIFKINMNAIQLHLTGVCVMTVLFNFIIVEGKHVAIERYKRLLFRRIKWNEDRDEFSMEGYGNYEGRKGESGSGVLHTNDVTNYKEEYDAYDVNEKLKNEYDNTLKQNKNITFFPNDNLNVFNNNTNVATNTSLDINQECTCSLIWNGTVIKKNFSNWKMLVAKTEMEVTSYLEQHDALHYYHIVKKHRDVLDDW
uniref:Uncharacterized protein n=1 Tax=Piliocolobus tephrosceles TaxID=591936 RepID=A0A8C9GYR2_9PRIM